MLLNRIAITVVCLLTVLTVAAFVGGWLVVDHTLINRDNGMPSYEARLEDLRAKYPHVYE